MTNIARLMKQAQEMQSKMAEMQAKLEAVEISGAAGGGMVTATLNGKGDLRGIKIDPALIVPADIEVLEDLIVAAVNEGIRKVDEVLAGQLGSLTGGLKIPGLF